MVGTPAKTVTRWASSSSSAWRGSKRGSSTSVAPMEKPALRFTVAPKVWNSGSATRWVSSPGWEPKRRLQVRAFITWLEWLSSAPLGCPVVPEVYSTTAVSVSRRWTVSKRSGSSATARARVGTPSS